MSEWPGYDESERDYPVDMQEESGSMSSSSISAKTTKGIIRMTKIGRVFGTELTNHGILPMSVNAEDAAIDETMTEGVSLMMKKQSTKRTRLNTYEYRSTGSIVSEEKSQASHEAGATAEIARTSTLSATAEPFVMEGAVSVNHPTMVSLATEVQSQDSSSTLDDSKVTPEAGEERLTFDDSTVVEAPKESTEEDGLDPCLLANIHIAETLYSRLICGIGGSQSNWTRLMSTLVLMHYECDIHPNTLHLAAMLSASFLGRQRILDGMNPGNMSLAACLALFSSAKFEDGFSLSVSKLIRHFDPAYEESKFLSAEVSFCHIVDFDFYMETRLSQAMRILEQRKLAQTEHDISQKYGRVKANQIRGVHLKFNSEQQLKLGFLTRYLCELSLWDLCFFQFACSEIAEAAVELALYCCDPSRTYSMRVSSSRVMNLVRLLHSLAYLGPIESPKYAAMRKNKSVLKYSKAAFLGVLDLIPPELGF